MYRTPNKGIVEREIFYGKYYMKKAKKVDNRKLAQRCAVQRAKVSIGIGLPVQDIYQMCLACHCQYCVNMVNFYDSTLSDELRDKFKEDDNVEFFKTISIQKELFKDNALTMEDSPLIEVNSRSPKKKKTAYSSEEIRGGWKEGDRAQLDADARVVHYLSHDNSVPLSAQDKLYLYQLAYNRPGDKDKVSALQNCRDAMKRSAVAQSIVTVVDLDESLLCSDEAVGSLDDELLCSAKFRDCFDSKCKVHGRLNLK